MLSSISLRPLGHLFGKGQQMSKFVNAIRRGSSLRELFKIAKRFGCVVEPVAVPARKRYRTRNCRGPVR